MRQPERSAGTPAWPDTEVEAVLRIGVLGSFTLALGDHRIDPATCRLVKGRHLLKLLALAPGHRLGREQLMDLLWPDLDPAAAANNLHYALYTARRVLVPPALSDGVTGSSLLQLREGILCLQAPGGIWVDALAFEGAAARARHTRDVSAYETALSLYGGDLLPDDLYEDWTSGRREALRELFLVLLAELAAVQEARGDVVAAAATLERLVATEPADEVARVALMRLYAGAGQRHHALRHYAQLQAVLQRELDAAPAPATSRLHEQILAGRFPTAVSTPAAQARPAPLPVPLTSFVGRGQDIAEVRRLAETNRLITLTGAGGVGKSRLALAVGAALMAGDAQSVWFVDLAPHADPELVAPAVASALGAPEEAGCSSAITLARALQDRSLLLVLDNCEHLAGACADLLTGLLGSCPGLQVLATSRLPLRVAGEVVWPVPPLSVPGTRHRPSPEALAASEAVALFVDRVRWRNPRFAVTAANATAVAAICRTLDGIPLALELAAARAAVLPVSAIAARLDDALALLCGSGGRGLPRQQALGATLDWSYNLLGVPEQRLLRALGTFAGSFGLAEAEQVWSGEGEAGSEVLSVLAGLIDASLVVLEETGGEPRYRVLETVRQYAVQRLEAAGEADVMRERHAACYLALAEQAENALLTPAQELWLENLERDHDNLRVALRWLLDRRHVAAQRLAGALWRFWAIRGHATEGRQWLALTLACGDEASGGPDAPSTREEMAVRAKALSGAGALARDQSDFGPAQAFLDRSLALRRALGEARGIATALNSLGNVAREQGDLAGAAAHYEESLALNRAADNTRGCAGALGNLGSVAQEQGDFARATACHEESLALYRVLEDQRGQAITLGNLGVLVHAQGDNGRAAVYLEQCLTLRYTLGDKRGQAITLANLATVVQAQGNHGRAAQLYGESLDLFPTVGDKRIVAVCLGGLGEIATAQGMPERAARLFAAADALRGAVRATLSPLDRASFEHSVAAVRAMLSEAAFSAAWETGRLASTEATLREARTLVPS